jgi:hypothetical protein
VALGSVGADILSLDVVERAAGYAIDDLVVELPPGAMPDMLITAAENIAGLYVDSIRPHTGLLRRTANFELIDHVAGAAGRADRLQVLVDEAPRVLRVGWCTVVELTEAGCAAWRQLRVRRDPRRDSPWLPIDHAQALDGTADWNPQIWRDMDTTLAAAPLGDAHGGGARTARRARFPAIGGGPPGYLAGIVATILR